MTSIQSGVGPPVQDDFNCNIVSILGSMMYNVVKVD